MKNKFAKIEARLQALIEGSAARLFPSGGQQKDLASGLIEAMRTSIRTDLDGSLLAPNLFILTVHPAQAQVLATDEQVLDSLTQTLREAAVEAGFNFTSPPVIRIESSPDLTPGEFRLQTRDSRRNLTQTSDIVIDSISEPSEIPPDAFLIVDGVRIFPLDRAVVNIGRREDNQIILDDPRVSRVHAQLRVIKGHFVIFDLDSTGGTFINSERVHQATLYPGDVISLSGVPLVYGQDAHEISETQDYEDRPLPHFSSSSKGDGSLQD